MNDYDPREKYAANLLLPTNIWWKECPEREEHFRSLEGLVTQEPLNQEAIRQYIEDHNEWYGSTYPLLKEMTDQDIVFACARIIGLEGERLLESLGYEE